ncbi:hypothetical protein BU16DRAFT_363986 [Lophium mytilinum]|uniref:Uncharacterized protein n=1 Tax=Lophium mytilinum TaxID=390894 RepID=A0A6A6QVU5_9PEZI|nr:hypothetical protein BU16DRAFT_363986 [Lophium mytilinum]
MIITPRRKQLYPRTLIGSPSPTSSPHLQPVNSAERETNTTAEEINRCWSPGGCTFLRPSTTVSHLRNTRTHPRAVLRKPRPPRACSAALFATAIVRLMQLQHPACY